MKKISDRYDDDDDDKYYDYVDFLGLTDKGRVEGFGIVCRPNCWSVW